MFLLAPAGVGLLWGLLSRVASGWLRWIGILPVRPARNGPGPRGLADREALLMAYAKTSLRKEKRELRDKMRAMGLDYREIAAEFARRYKLRPRAAWREAYGWSLQDTAD